MSGFSSDGGEPQSGEVAEEEDHQDQDRIEVDTFDVLHISQEHVAAVKATWNRLLTQAETEEAAGEAIYKALFEGAPAMRPLFKTPRAIQAIRFSSSIARMVEQLHDAKQLKVLVEALGFGHLQLDLSLPKVMLFRDIIISVLETELTDDFSQDAREGWLMFLNYIGGALIYFRTTYAERLRILVSSWHEAHHGAQKSGELKGLKAKRSSGEELSSGEEDAKDTIAKGQVPTTFEEMFSFNAAVMGFGNRHWMDEVLVMFENMVLNVSDPGRLEQESEVLALRIVKRGYTLASVNLAEFRACMLASLRSLLPRAWDTSYEVAWNWLWENIERLIKKALTGPLLLGDPMRRVLDSFTQEERYDIRKDVYDLFFVAAPSGQEFFKQSNTRLHFIAERILQLTLELFDDPWVMVDELSALGLRHVGFGIPTELFGPFVSCSIKALMTRCKDPAVIDAFRWSLGLLAKMLVRAITEGSTIVMKAININSARQLRKAASCAGRAHRARCLLLVQVGTKNISPLSWALESGRLEAAQAILEDLLTIRADRERYYYGLEELYDRHPDIFARLVREAPTLLETVLDGLIWRSRVTTNGLRKANYYIKYLIVDKEGGVSDALAQFVLNADPQVISHPVITLASDTLWTGIVSQEFLLRRLWIFVSLAIYLLSQAILPKISTYRTDVRVRAVVFVGRLLMYSFTLPRLLYRHARLTFRAYSQRTLERALWIPLPEYLQDFHEMCSLLLAILLVVMLACEPYFRCTSAPNWPAEDCSAGLAQEQTYSVVGMVATLAHWVLTSDLAVFSTGISAFVIVCAAVAKEINKFLVALAFMLVTFASCTAVLEHSYPNMQNLADSMLCFLSVMLYLVWDDWRDFRIDPFLLVIVYIFCVCSTIMLINLLICQLNCTYVYIYQNMAGFARLQRAEVISDTLATIQMEKWTRFVQTLGLDQPLEFNEGDIGMSGGLQIWEQANLNMVARDRVQRFGGLCAPDLQWPEESHTGGHGGDEAVEEGSEKDKEAKLRHVEKVMRNALKRLAASGHMGAGGSSGMTSQSDGASQSRGGTASEVSGSSAE